LRHWLGDPSTDERKDLADRCRQILSAKDDLVAKPDAGRRARRLVTLFSE
jgi:hypothetical protein